jgi:hypothetical protein
MLRGLTASELDFTPPSDANFDTAPVSSKVFHPNGGRAAFQNVDPNTVELDANGVPLGQWAFVRASIQDVGLNIGGNIIDDDIVAILTYVRKGVCEQINEQVTGSTDIPDNFEPNIDMSDIIAVVGSVSVINGQLGVNGQPFMCVRFDSVGSGNYYYAYYHVLVEQ